MANSMKTLSVVNVIFLPMGVVVGAMGMNVRLPGMFYTDASGTFLVNNNYAAFFTVMCLLAVLAVLMMLFLRAIR